MTVLLQAKRFCILATATFILLISSNYSSASANTHTPSTRPIVLELFTSQGCSSCPAADKLLKEIDDREDNVLALSYHVAYWDHLGWKDLYAKPKFANRQRAYAKILHDHIYTPQMIIDGVSSVIGSNDHDIARAMRFARTSKPEIPISIEKKGDELHVHVAGANADAGVSVPIVGTIQLVLYRDIDVDNVKAGENAGHTLKSYHNVTLMKMLGIWKREEARFTIPTKLLEGQNVAILLQSEAHGRIVGAATYTPDNQ